MPSVFQHLLYILYARAHMPLLSESLLFVFMFIHWTKENYWVKKYETIISMHIVPHCYLLCEPSAQCCQRPFFTVIFAGINIHAQLSLYNLVLNSPLTFFHIEILSVCSYWSSLPWQDAIPCSSCFIQLSTYATTSTIIRPRTVLVPMQQVSINHSVPQFLH